MHIKSDGWLDDTLLPLNQLPLLNSLLGQRLVDIQRSLSIKSMENNRKGQDFFRKSLSKIVLQFEGLSPIYIDDYWYHKQERSLDISLDPRGFGAPEESGRNRRFTLQDREYVDDQLHNLIGQRLTQMYVLIRKNELRGDRYRALQDSLQLTFENETTIIICYFLGSLAGALQIRYPEEIRWDAVRYKIDITKGKAPWLYRLNRWKWRYLYYLEHR